MNKTEFWLMNNPFRRLSLRFEADKLRKMSPVNTPKYVLEIGCGEGQGTKHILRLWNPEKIDALDLDPKMIARAKQRTADKRVSFRVADAARLPHVEAETYDAVFDFAIIHHIPDWESCLEELYRVLKPGGYLHIEDFSIDSFTQNMPGRVLKKLLDHPYKQMYTKAAFDKELKRIGFETVTKADLGESYAFWRVLRKSVASSSSKS